MSKCAKKSIKGAGAPPSGNCSTAWKGLYCGEGMRATGTPYKVDSGAHYLPRPGFETTTKDIGEWAYFGQIDNENFLESASLVGRSSSGEFVPVSKAALFGKSVALLFSALSHPKCTNFIPFLKQFYKNVNEAGQYPKIEIIFVSMDGSKEDYIANRNNMPWLSVEYNSPLQRGLINKFDVKAFLPGRSDGRFLGKGIPKLIVVGHEGQPIHWLPCEHQSPNVLREWDIYSNRWPLVSSTETATVEAVENAEATKTPYAGTSWGMVQKLR